MGLEFLARVRTTSTWLGGVAALVVATYVSADRGIALAAGVLWSLVNLQLLERFVITWLTPGRRPDTLKITAILGGMLALLGFGALLLTLLPPAVLVGRSITDVLTALG